MTVKEPFTACQLPSVTDQTDNFKQNSTKASVVKILLVETTRTLDTSAVVSRKLSVLEAEAASTEVFWKPFNCRWMM
jgi:hypothetical protein